MSELFGVDLSGLVLDALGGQLQALTLHKLTQGTPDAYGVPTSSSADYTGEGVRSKWSSDTVLKRGYPKDVVKIIVLQNGLVEPSKDDQITILGSLYRIIDKERDPVDATWSLAAVKV